MQNEIRLVDDTELPNPTLPQTESTLKGVDFVKLYRLIFKPKPKKKPAGPYVSADPFVVVVRERYTDYFFVETLKIPAKEIELFISFCDQGEKTNFLLNPQKEFELTDYLISRSAEYLEKDK